jgi:hypothetical protein
MPSPTAIRREGEFMTKLIALIVLILLLAVAGGYYYLYPPELMKRQTQKALTDFSKAVASKDRGKIALALNTIMTNPVKMRLEVDFLPVTGTGSASGMAQDFDKSGFITFIDNTLYSLTDYGYVLQLNQFMLDTDKKTAKAEFTSQEWGDGMAYYGGMGICSHFNSETLCDGEVDFAGNQAHLDKATCKTQLRSSPKKSNN